ncbi:MAG: hypothetical protein FWD99_02985 [Oscillospiraceae bacterium]|nr:hypothetical protein [Oscillospiraceae bacterium]
MIREYRTIWEITDSLLTVKDVEGVTCGELAQILLSSGEIRTGKVLEAAYDQTVVEVFGSTVGMNPAESKIRFLGHGQELGVSGDILGRIFNGMGQPVDGGPEILAEHYLDIHGAPVNPVARERSLKLIQTGISAIDDERPLMRGQTLAIFSELGQSHASLVAQIAQETRASGKNTDFAVVFAGIDISFEESEHVVQELKRTGCIGRSACFISLTDAPTGEQVAAPRMALTAAEYLAFEKDMHVLVILTDTTNYADPAALYERAGCRKGKSGSITLLSVLTGPTHTNSLTDGQVTL